MQRSPAQTRPPPAACSRATDAVAPHYNGGASSR